jgi:CubicO group peptidase (beta-lactamase class C family)
MSPNLFVIAVFVCSMSLGTAANYNETIAKVSRLAQSEVREGRITGVTIALIDDQELIFAGGFGLADRKSGTPAQADTVYRAGSISKLFTAMATMQLVERGRIDIDAPVTNYLPEFRIIVPFEDAKPLTLRQLMCHRSGMVRESPVGSYFDDSEPGIQRTVASLASCVLVYPPATHTKYSNSGVTVVGHVVERIAGIPYAVRQQNELLGPLAMGDSAFLRTPAIRKKLAKGYLPVAKPTGGFAEIEAPVFEFGLIPAGNLYTTAEDLARFLMCLAADGRVADRQLLQSNTLAGMFVPQLTTDTNGFGIGFSVGHLRGRKTVGHMGAVYGFTSSITLLPEEKIGVVVLCNDDIVVGPVRKLSAGALDSMLFAKTGERASKQSAPFSLTRSELGPFSGDYESQSYWAHLEISGEKLVAVVSGQKVELSPIGALRFEGNGRVAYNAPFTFDRDSVGQISGFTGFEQKFQRIHPQKTPLAPVSWQSLVGAYGPAFIPLIISVKHGHLYAMTENEFDYRLSPINGSVFQMPPGLYEGEQIVFQSDRSGKVHTAVLANMPLRRR